MGAHLRVLHDMNAWLFCDENIAPAIKSVKALQKDWKQDGIEVRTPGLLDGKFVDTKGIDGLPTKKDLIAMIAVGIKQVLKIARGTRVCPTAPTVKAIADGKSTSSRLKTVAVSQLARVVGTCFGIGFRRVGLSGVSAHTPSWPCKQPLAFITTVSSLVTTRRTSPSQQKPSGPAASPEEPPPQNAPALRVCTVAPPCSSRSRARCLG